ncbi:MAG TPA: LON peptidase substrate-binding domain-containing protein [Candidatus Angelobacter sp.]|nr:LON peptidase substrate-binding domain-containing protein [Candidatus Angelobacter sp.]
MKVVVGLLLQVKELPCTEGDVRPQFGRDHYHEAIYSRPLAASQPRVHCRIMAVSLLPIFPLEVVLFPGAPLPLHIFEPRYKEMIAECLENKKPFGMVRAKENAVAEVGCSAVILNVMKRYEDGRMDISSEGRKRFAIVELNHDRSFLQAEVTWFDDDEPAPLPGKQSETAIELHEQFFAVLGQDAEIDKTKNYLSFQLANQLPVDLDFKQAILEMKSENERIETLIEYYRATIPKVEKTLRARERASGNGHIH